MLFICLLLTVFLIIGVIMGGPPPQSYEQEYAAEIEAYRAKKVRGRERTLRLRARGMD